MVSYQGTYEFLDNKFAYPESVFRPQPVVKTYPENTVMWYLDQFHPRFAMIVKKSRLDWQMADAQFRGTLFLPLDRTIDENAVLNMDANTARKIVKYHMMTGFFPRNVLYTSQFQQLQTTIKGYSIQAYVSDQNKMILNLNTPIIYFDILLTNGVIHIITNLLNHTG